MQLISLVTVVVSLCQIVAVQLRIRLAIISPGQEVFPLDLPLADSCTKLFVFFPSPRHHANKQAIPEINLAKILRGRQLAVCHVDEIRSFQKLLQRGVTGGMKTVVGLISGVNSVRDRDRAIGGHRKPQHQLLQVRSMVFIDAVREPLLGAPSWILPGKRHRRRVEVDSRAVELKDLDDSKG